MSKIEIFDPAMCCSTGVCGPSINKELLRVATVINNMIKKGFNITRHNLSSEPQAFIDNKKINEYLNSEGAEVLPITLVDGEVKKLKEYPTNEEFANWLGVSKEDLSHIAIKKPGKGCGTSGKKGCC
ncbi:arsenite efflux transporter metallochaperone ArsD [Clostridium felsineum]|uniref:Arsenical resistance operon trans-acting repressor ArsD n=1 Tax=Clostridium felsineum TaxID=36839 RepID=A0A1S8MF31_9CLOT|nr:arsenite efflux transporter metallochaperone ArsD [Clostridium felsineum]URZ04676.1 Arsenical resistance operon trans-acting repressor ArsD [Clostridium felsineum]URZ09196.1 Arsenical resistance operon trans-acting repressor ArsD [Clostridium felsineum]URZ13882.1 Arsenical resistance operon trans-acting repressor ArsD [Clostridium felsineum]